MTWNAYTAFAVGICAVLIYFFVFSFAKAIRFTLRFLLRMALGMGGIAAFNTVAAAYGIVIGLNIYTCTFCGIFGLPGYILLLGTRLIC